MMMSLLAGIIVGLVLAIPPGPVAVTAMKLTMDKGTRHGTFVGLGTGLMDFIFCIIAMFAATGFILLADSFIADYPFFFLILQLSVVFGILIYGIINLRSKKKSEFKKSESLSERFAFISYLKNKGPFLLGIAIALANTANPSFLASLTYIAVQVQKWGMIEVSSLGRFSFALGFGLGNFFWIYILVKTINFYKPRMSEDIILKIRKFAGLTLIGFGTLLGYRVLELTKWSDIIRFLFAI